MSQTRLSSLLSLPRELRNIVYLDLIEEINFEPDDPDHAGERLVNGTTYIQTQSPRPALLQMNLVSRQLHAEVQDTINQHVSSESEDLAHLDIMVKGPSIWPTWISLPLTQEFPSTVKVSLRLFEAKGYGAEFSIGAYRCLWSLFNMLVFRGACFIHHTGQLSEPLRIKRLVLDIRLCFPTSVDVSVSCLSPRCVSHS